MSRNPLLRGLRPTHPGEILRETILPATGRSKAEIANLLGISRQHLYDILNEKKPISVDMALRFGKLLGNGPDIWIGLQRDYDVAMAETALAGELARIPTLSAA